MGVLIGRGGYGIHGDPPHQGVHQEAAYDHIREGVMPPYLCTVHGGGLDVGDEPVGAMVGSRRGKLTGGIDE